MADLQEGYEYTDEEEEEILQKLTFTAYADKREEIQECVETLLEEDGEKVVIMCWHHAVVDDLMKRFPDALRVDGRVPSGKRQAIVDEFNSNPGKRILIGNIQAAGVTFSMTGAHNMVFAELCWNPTDAEQAEDRICRMTTIADQLNYYYFVVANSIEEKLIYTMDKKARMASQILDGASQSYFKGIQKVSFVREVLAEELVA